MAKPSRSKAERMFVLAEERDAGSSVKALLETEPVKQWLEATQKLLVSRVTAAAGGDGELLRIAGLQLQTFLQFKAALNVAAGQVTAAEKQIERLKDGRND